MNTSVYSDIMTRKSWLFGTIPAGFELRMRMLVERVREAVRPASDRRQAKSRFMDISRRQGSLISSICLSFARSKEEFEDLRQETLLNIWRGLDNFREFSTTSTWVYRVTLNTCVSSMRKSKVSERQTEAFNEFYRQLFDTSTEQDIQRYELMYSLIAKLPPIDKSVLLMWLDDKPYEEIAEVMGLSRNAVASRLKRARDRLAAMASDSNSAIY